MAWGQPDAGSTAQAEDFSFNSEGVDPDKVERGGGLVDKEGMYHVEISDVELDLKMLKESGKNAGSANTPSVCFHLLVLHSVDGQSPEGAQHFHRIYLRAAGGGAASEGALGLAMKFASRLGLVVAKDVDGRKVFVDPQTGTTKIPVSLWERAKGMQAIVQVKFEKSDNPNFKDSYKIPFSEVYQVDDPRVAKVPKNAVALAMIGKKSAADTNGESAPGVGDDLSGL